MTEDTDTVWGMPGIGNFISGIKHELIEVGGADVVVHVTFPPGTPKDRSAAFAKKLREQFPTSVRMVFTTPGVQLSVHRPKTINLNISDCPMTMGEIKEKIDRILKEKADTINIRLHNISFEGKKKNGGK